MGEGSRSEFSKLESSTMEWRRRKLGDPMLGLQLVQVRGRCRVPRSFFGKATKTIAGTGTRHPENWSYEEHLYVPSPWW